MSTRSLSSRVLTRMAASFPMFVFYFMGSWAPSVLAEDSVNEAGTSAIALYGSGTTNPSKFVWEVMELLETRTKIPVKASYRAVGSTTGQIEFTGDDASNYLPYSHFGMGDIPVTQARYDEIAGAGHEMVHIPFVVGSVSIFHSIPGVPSGKQGLNLTSCLLGKIFARTITTWDDPEVKELNPELQVPSDQNILVVHRVKGSSSTAGTTEYLDKACGAPDWPLGSGSTIEWPEDTFGAEGSGGVTEFLQTNEYAIGYLDSGHGVSAGLSEIELENKDGYFLNSQEADVGSAGTIAVAENLLPDATGDWSEVNLYNLPGKETWPISLFSYAYVRTDQTADPVAGSFLKAFLTFLNSDEGQDIAEEYAFAKIPKEVRDINTQTIALLNTGDGAPEWTFETATDPINGMGDYVISVKRQSSGTVKQSSTDSQVSSLEARVAELEALIEDLTGMSIESMPLASPPPDGDGPSGDSGDDDPSDVAIAALAISSAAFCMTVIAVCLGMMALSSRRDRNDHSTANGSSRAHCVRPQVLSETKVDA